MNKLFVSVSACLIVANCNATTTSTQITPMPAGYADGIKTLTTEGLIFTANSKAGVTDSAGNTVLADATFEYRTTSDPNQIVATINGEDVTMTFDGSTGQYSGSSANYLALAVAIVNSADNQASLLGFQYDDTSAGSSTGGFAASGLKTNPTEIAALSGTATFNGAAHLLILHGNASTGGFSGGIGSVVLNADFGAGTVSGSMSIADDGTSGVGYVLSPTTITINPATISGNGFFHNSRSDRR